MTERFQDPQHYFLKSSQMTFRQLETSANKIKIYLVAFYYPLKLFSPLDMDLLVSLDSVTDLVVVTQSVTNSLNYRSL